MYLYTRMYKYIPMPGPYKDHAPQASIRIFVEGRKNTPLVITFLRWENGMRLTRAGDDENDIFNINLPATVRKLILHGSSKGWDGEEKMEIENGLAIAKELGYDTSYFERYSAF